MICLRIFTIFVLINRIKCQNYCISNRNSTASTATTLCDLATPIYSVQGNNYKISLNNITDGSYWVGWSETAFSYIGCIMPDGINESQPHSVDANPTACYYSCNSTAMFIGIQSEMQSVKCYCLHERPTDVTLNTCGDKCIFPDSTLCGSKKENGKNVGVSIYQKVAIFTNTFVIYGPAIPAHCLAYQPVSYGDGYYFWTACSHELRKVCSNGSANLILGRSSNKTWTDWSSTMESCLKDGMVPPTETANFSTLKEASPFWTSVIRSFYVCNSTASLCSQVGLQGYITKSSMDESYTLRFGANEELQAVCAGINATACSNSTPITLTNTTTTTTTTTTQASTTWTDTSTSKTSTASAENSSTEQPTVTDTTISSTHPGPGHDTTTATHSSSTSENSTMRSTEPPRVDANENLEAKGEKSNIVAVYVAVPIILILIAVVMGFIMWRKWKQLCFDKTKEKDSIQNGGTPLNDFGTTAISNSAYEGNGTVGHDYFMLEPTNEYAAIQDSDIAKASKDEEYDTTTAVQAEANGNFGTGNIYNRLDEVTDDTYNHCDNKTLVCDDTYSQINNENNIGPANDSRGITSAGMISLNDTYNHITKKASVEANTTLMKPEKAQSDTTEDDGAKSPPKAFKLERQNYDYAYATAAKGKEAQKPGMFTLSQLPNSGDYAFAKEPQTTTPSYELAKPTPVYMELSNE